MWVRKTSRKYPRKSKNAPPKSHFQTFGGIFDFLVWGYFLTLNLRTHKKTAFDFDFFCDFGPGRLGDPCKWQLGSQCLPSASCVCLWCGSVPSVVGEEFTGSEKLGLAPKVLQTFGFCVRVLQVFYFENHSAETSCRTPQIVQNSGWDLTCSVP